VALLETSLDEEKSVKSAGTVVLLDEKECTNWGECEVAPPPFFAALVLGGGHGDAFGVLLPAGPVAPVAAVAALVPFALAFKTPNGCCCSVVDPPLTFKPRLLVVVATESMTDCCTQTRCNCSLGKQLAVCLELLGTTSRGGPLEIPLLLEKVVNDGNGGDIVSTQLGQDSIPDMQIGGNLGGIGRVAQFFFPAHAPRIGLR
jgi:hypothetical protein